MFFVVNSSCHNANWWASFDNEGWSKCPDTSPYINGFLRSHVMFGLQDWIYNLEEAACCKNGTSDVQCVQANWMTSFERQDFVLLICMHGARSTYNFPVIQKEVVFLYIYIYYGTFDFSARFLLYYLALLASYTRKSTAELEKVNRKIAHSKRYVYTIKFCC